MNLETISPLGPKGARLLAFLSGEIIKGRIRKREPKTFLAYSDALRGMGIPVHGRAGQQLQREGLDELNQWTTDNPDLPKIAGLIVNRKSRRPSAGFAKSHGREAIDWEEWWLAETARAIEFDWAPFLVKRAPSLAPPRVREGEEGEAASYRDIIVLDPPPAHIRRSRITVGDVLRWLAAGMSEAEVLRQHTELSIADIRASLAYAADREPQGSTLGFTDRWMGKFTLPAPDPSDARLTYLLERYERNRK